jgi:hypothetical protein
VCCGAKLWLREVRVATVGCVLKGSIEIGKKERDGLCGRLL